MRDDYATSPYVYMDLGVIVQLPVVTKIHLLDQGGYVIDLTSRSVVVRYMGCLFGGDFWVED